MPVARSRRSLLFQHAAASRSCACVGEENYGRYVRTFSEERTLLEMHTRGLSFIVWITSLSSITSSTSALVCSLALVRTLAPLLLGSPHLHLPLSSSPD